MPADAHADRMAFALRAFAEVARDAVRDVVGEARERFQVLDGAVQLRTLVRMADDDYFRTSVDDALATRFQALLSTPARWVSGTRCRRRLRRGWRWWAAPTPAVGCLA